MAANPIHNYFENNAITENDKYGFTQFTRSNAPRSQLFSTGENTLTGIRSVNIPSRRDTYRMQLNNPGPLTQAARKGIDIYRQNNQILQRGGGQFQSSVKLYQQAGPKIVRQSYSFVGSSNQPGSLDVFVNSINTNINRAINEYRRNAISGRNSSNLLKRGADLYLRTGQNLINTSYLFTRNLKISSRNTQRTNITTLMNQGITQYQSGNASTKRNDSPLTHGTGLYLKTGFKRLQEPILLQNL
ncbi:hypothetical protein ACFL4V_01420 [Candidatus Latescibacterota bacterium]